MGEFLRWSLIVAAAAIIAWLVVRTIRRARELSDRIEGYHREQEERPGDPYAALAEMLAEQRERDSRTAINRATAGLESWCRLCVRWWRRILLRQ